ncbi:hypothetical protein D3C80_2003250 [compost metagenome]
MEQRDVVVFQDAQVDIPAAKSKTPAQHVDDAVGQRVEFTEIVAAIALDVDQGFPITEPHGQVTDRVCEVHYCHCSFSVRACGARPLRSSSRV